PPKYVKWYVYKAPRTSTLAIKNLRRARLSSEMAEGVVYLLLVSPCVVKAAELVLRVALPPEPAYSTYVLRKNQFSPATLRLGLPVFALAIPKRVAVLRDGQIDCVARIGALCMRLQRIQPTELTRIFGLILICVHSYFLCFQMADPQGWTARGSIQSLRPSMAVSQQRGRAIEQSNISTLPECYLQHSGNILANEIFTD
ncbi:MAG: hypothetical protein EZS28_021694, partial [Streblomastix strix]